ncbi:monoglyceride lipase-like [Brienomyrus brachyistius]|uniref:monoglyceride lipase-like n=1 Tax=Brienomyrus brachyistius TaxID=42636 RepID=UPI0020B3B095|nr:monoglyceride lipase-like [Brienomyrus brachyistius]
MSESGVTPQGDWSRDHIVNADGQRLFCRYWVPEEPPRGLLFVAHGVGEHCGRYSSLAQSLSQRGLIVFAHDHVGHGRSEGERMMVRDFKVYIRDSLQHVDLMKEQYPGLPLFILGHSMGGAISILCACERPSDFTGVVLISPMVQLNPESASPFKVFMAKLLNHVLPSLSLGSIDSKWISRDQKEVESYDTDELNHHGGLSVAFAMQLVGAARLVERAIPTVTWPFLLLHGDADKLCNISGSHMMLEKAQSTDKQLKVYNGAYHVLHHELPETTECVLRDITDWVVTRIPDQAASGS